MTTRARPSAGRVFASAGTVLVSVGRVFGAAGSMFASALRVFASAGTGFASAGTGFTSAGWRVASTAGAAFFRVRRAVAAGGLRAGVGRSGGLIGREQNGGERRKRQRQGMAAALGADRRGLHPAEIAHATAAIDRRIAVEDLAPAAGLRHAQDVIRAGHRREITNDEHRRTGTPEAQESEHARLGVAEVDPFEAGLL